MSEQLHLINTHSMASTKTMARMLFDRTVKAIGLRRIEIRSGVSAQVSNDPTELHLPDEGRSWNLGRQARCAECGRTVPVLSRKFVGGRLLYSVQCAGHDCGHQTPWLETSDAAVRHWSMTSLLART